MSSYDPKSGTIAVVEQPAAWMMDKFVPPPDDLTHLSPETKLRMIRAERMKDRKNSNSGRTDPGNALWWSPTSWIQNWVESSL